MLLAIFSWCLTAQENAKTFSEQYEESFAHTQMDKFNNPTWDFFQHNTLVKITDNELLTELENVTSFNREYCNFYFYTLENRMDYMDDFTVFCDVESEGRYIFYVFFEERKAIDGCFLANEVAIGEYAEASFGEFLGKLHYRKQVHEMSEGFEGPDGYEEGEEEVKVYEYVFPGGGAIERKLIEE